MVLAACGGATPASAPAESPAPSVVPGSLQEAKLAYAADPSYYREAACASLESLRVAADGLDTLMKRGDAGEDMAALELLLDVSVEGGFFQGSDNVVRFPGDYIWVPGGYIWRAFESVGAAIWEAYPHTLVVSSGTSSPSGLEAALRAISDAFLEAQGRVREVGVSCPEGTIPFLLPYAAPTPWAPSDFDRWSATIYYKWERPGKSMYVVTRNGCDMLYVEVTYLTAGDVVVGSSNAIASNIRPVEKALLNFNQARSSTQVRVAEMNCL